MAPGWFYSYRSVFHGSRWFFMFFYGSRSGFHDARGICIVINGPRLDYFGAERHRPEVRKPKRYSLHPYPGPTIPLGLAGRRPALA